jgi:hypothetical protein
VAPIALLNAASLGVEYEGGNLLPALESDPTELDFVNHYFEGKLFQDPRWMKRYLIDNGYCHWGYDYNIWLIGCDQWVVAGREENQTIFEFSVSWPRVVEILNGLDPDRRVSITLHPCYFGKRVDDGAFPVAG